MVFVSMRCWAMFLTAGMISRASTDRKVPRGVWNQLRKTRRHVLLRGKRCNFDPPPGSGGAVIRA
jgi:hypothetical protein